MGGEDSPRSELCLGTPKAYAGEMRIFLLLCAVLSAMPLSGCLWHKKTQPKSATHVYEGDGPGIRTLDRPESAGGALTTY